MLKFLIDKEWENLYWILTIGSLVWVVVGVLIFVDFHHGTQKAKQLNEEITSEGIKRTIRKSVYYYLLLFLGGVFDFFNTLTTSFLPYPWELVPLFTTLIGLGLCFTEAKSITEKADEKLRRRTKETARQMLELMEKRGDIINTIIEKAKEQEKKAPKKD